MGKHWTEADLQKLDALKKSGMSRRAIAEELGRTHKSIIAKLEYLSLTPEMKRLRQQAEALRQRGTKRVKFPDGTMPKIETPAEVLQDRNFRLALRPRDLTALVCGDPKPGYSALERRA